MVVEDSMARSRALTIAVVAIVLLIVSITVDATMNRSYAVDVKDNGDWRTVASTPRGDGRYSVAEPVGYGSVPVAPNGTVELRLRADNGYPFALDQHYLVRFNGAIAAEGDIHAPARGTGESAFNLSAAKIFAAGGPVKGPDAAGAGSPRTASANFDVEVGGKSVYVYFNIQEAS